MCLVFTQEYAILMFIFLAIIIKIHGVEKNMYNILANAKELDKKPRYIERGC